MPKGAILKLNVLDYDITILQNTTQQGCKQKIQIQQLKRQTQFLGRVILPEAGFILTIGQWGSNGPPSVILRGAKKGGFPPFLLFEESGQGGIKGTSSRFSACSFIQMLFFCRDMLYCLCTQYDHVIIFSKNQSAHSPGSYLINLFANSCKFINHGIKPSSQQYIQRW